MLGLDLIASLHWAECHPSNPSVSWAGMHCCQCIWTLAICVRCPDGPAWCPNQSFTTWRPCMAQAVATQASTLLWCMLYSETTVAGSRLSCTNARYDRRSCAEQTSTDAALALKLRMRQSLLALRCFFRSPLLRTVATCSGSVEEV